LVAGFNRLWEPIYILLKNYLSRKENKFILYNDIKGWSSVVEIKNNKDLEKLTKRTILVQNYL